MAGWNLTNAETDALSLSLAKLPYLSDWDPGSLKLVFEDIIAVDLDLTDLTGFSIGEIDVILDPEEASQAADPADDLPVIPDKDRAVARSGDLFQLGRHRIACGNALEPDSLSLLMGGEHARAVITDPPYNIPIANNVSGLGKVRHGDFAMASGEMTFDQFVAFLLAMLRLCVGRLPIGALLYVFMDRRHLEELLLAGRKAGLTLVDLCIWNKLSGGMGSFYRSQHEPCAVFRHGSSPHLNNVRCHTRPRETAGRIPQVHAALRKVHGRAAHLPVFQAR